MAVCIMPSPSHTRVRRCTGTWRAQGVEITFEEDRQGGGVLNGPRAYFHDPDWTVLELIDLTSYAGSPSENCLIIASCGPFLHIRKRGLF